jgi:hypothetical protein
VEAAIDDGDDKANKAATKALKPSSSSDDDERAPRSKQGITHDTVSQASAGCPISRRKRVSDIATPASTTGSMDSDDEFMTDVSSHEEDFLGTQGSDDESLGEGM